MNMDTTEIRNKAKNLNKARTKTGKFFEKMGNILSMNSSSLSLLGQGSEQHCGGTWGEHWEREANDNMQQNHVHKFTLIPVTSFSTGDYVQSMCTSRQKLTSKQEKYK